MVPRGGNGAGAEPGMHKGPVADLQTMLAAMSPVLNGIHVAYVSTREPKAVIARLDESSLIGTFVEAEGTTLLVDLRAAEALGLPIMMKAAWITLTVNSALEACGLTAAFAQALTDENISCNVVAAAHHDHIFVPVADAGRAMAALLGLQGKHAAIAATAGSGSGSRSQ